MFSWCIYVLLSFLPKLGQLLLELRDSLALLSMAILRTVSVNLLAFDAAVAVRLASLAQLASNGIQWDAAGLAMLSHLTQMLTKYRYVFLGNTGSIFTDP